MKMKKKWYVVTMSNGHRWYIKTRYPYGAMSKAEAKDKFGRRAISCDTITELVTSLMNVLEWGNPWNKA